MHNKSRPSLVQIMACHLFGTMPLSEAMMAYKLDHKEHISMIEIQKFSFTKMY